MDKLKPFQQTLGALALLAILLFSSGCATQRTFSSPDQAVGSLVDALRAGDQQQLRAILGSSESTLLSSGDAVADQNNVDLFLAHYDEKHSLVPQENGAMSLVIGTNDWPMPIPIVKEAGKDAWRFDAAAGKDEIINRRIGRNELDTIQVCMAIVDAQKEYAMQDPDHAGLPAYAEKFLSDPGRKNGLYWETKEGEPPSPLGALMATAEDQGYKPNQNSKNNPRPYLGYYYRMLSSQGPNAKGGARDYKLGGRMFDGFAVVAYPAIYGNSGIMTFIVNQDGIVYQRDLGADTTKAAESMTSFDPDSNWKKVEPAAPEKQ
jgi:Protein of unknown function (DUF2950)